MKPPWPTLKYTHFDVYISPVYLKRMRKVRKIILL